MTIVTTSRKPVPEVRSLARDLAFALECEYIIRGKLSMNEIREKYPVVFLVSGEKKSIRLQLITTDGIAADYLIQSGNVNFREKEFTRGIFVSNQSIYEKLRQFVPVVLSEGTKGTLTYDGTKRRHYMLELNPYGT
jgi:U3 small nucleolar ribonucleoprotein protein IMP4